MTGEACPDCGLTATHLRHEPKVIENEFKHRRIPGFTECVQCGAGWHYDNEETPMDTTDEIARILFEHARDDINPAAGHYGCDCSDVPGNPRMTATEHRRHVAEVLASWFSPQR